MTFEEYMQAAREELQLGGISEEDAYVRALKANRPDLWDQLKNATSYDPTKDASNFSYFITWVFANWYKETV